MKQRHLVTFINHYLVKGTRVVSSEASKKKIVERDLTLSKRSLKKHSHALAQYL